MIPLSFFYPAVIHGPKSIIALVETLQPQIAFASMNLLNESRYLAIYNSCASPSHINALALNSGPTREPPRMND